MITRAIENLKNEFHNIKFLNKRELQQITIAVIISGMFAAIGFSLLDLLLNFIIQKFLFV
ncbi:MAG: preprotein translocase SecE subunit [Candidatus Deianiraeaceae bacterium]|jgi:preprotein translocase SecE subunit